MSKLVNFSGFVEKCWSEIDFGFLAFSFRYWETPFWLKLSPHGIENRFLASRRVVRFNRNRTCRRLEKGNFGKQNEFWIYRNHEYVKRLGLEICLNISAYRRRASIFPIGADLHKPDSWENDIAQYVDNRFFSNSHRQSRTRWIGPAGLEPPAPDVGNTQNAENVAQNTTRAALLPPDWAELATRYEMRESACREIAAILKREGVIIADGEEHAIRTKRN